MPPNSWTIDDNIRLLPLGILSFDSCSPTFKISFPVDKIETVGFLDTVNQTCPVIAIDPR